VLIYTIRHGQTQWNAERRLQGQKDIPMNATGREQARQNGIALARLLGERIGEFDFVASPLGRTRATMEIMRTVMGLPAEGYRTDPRLVEISFGDWEGSTLKELRVSQRERVQERNAGKWNFIPPGEFAESYEILSWRTASWLNSVERPTVCVTHGGVIRTFFKMVAGLPEDVASEGEIPQDRIARIETAEQTIGWL
jgi:probable phosphoglycerate mutase